MFKAAGLNAGLIAQLSCLCDLPQLASRGHRAHAACVRARARVCPLFVYLCVSTLAALAARLDVIVCVAFNVCVLMSVFVLRPSRHSVSARVCVCVCVRARRG